MSETPTPESMTAGFAPVDREHAAQINLLNALEAAVNGGRGEEAHALLEQFVELTNAHFLSEQLIMRNHAYEAYEAHVQEHDQLMAEARGFRESIARGDGLGMQGVVASLRNWLMIHLMTTDAVMEAYLSKVARAQSAATAGASVSVSGD